MHRAEHTTTERIPTETLHFKINTTNSPLYLLTRSHIRLEHLDICSVFQCLCGSGHNADKNWFQNSIGESKYKMIFRSTRQTELLMEAKRRSRTHSRRVTIWSEHCYGYLFALFDRWEKCVEFLIRIFANIGDESTRNRLRIRWIWIHLGLHRLLPKRNYKKKTPRKSEMMQRFYEILKIQHQIPAKQKQAKIL